jgi:hypothetical protein
MCVQCFQFPFNVGTVVYNNNYLFPAKIRTDNGDSMSTQMEIGGALKCDGYVRDSAILRVLASKRDAVSMRVMDV